MLSWSASPFTNCRSGEPRPGTGVALYELVRSKLYSVGLNRTPMALPLSAPSRTVMVAFLSCALLMVPSQPAPLALDADAPLDPPDHIIGQSIQQTRVDVRRRKNGRPSLVRLNRRCVWHMRRRRCLSIDDRSRGMWRRPPNEIGRTMRSA